MVPKAPEMIGRRALITGITGQDGSYLAEFLLAKGYEVHGIKRRSSSLNTARLDHLYADPHDPEVAAGADGRLYLHYGDVTDGSSLARILRIVEPHEVYNLAAQSHVRVSFELPEYTTQAVACGTLAILEAIRQAGINCRFYQASSSEMFGSSPPPQNELTPFRPRSPYACAKVFAHHITVNYREAHGMFAVSGILFNHESPRRGETFVSRKITRAVARIKHGLQQKLYLGNLRAMRDWGYAPEYVEAMWLMLQMPEPQDFVIGTGYWYSVQQFAQVAFKYAGLNWRDHVEFDPRYVRPAEVDCLQADPVKAHSVLAWRHHTGFHDLVRIMVDADIKEMLATMR